jgi:hypothetical protein
MSRDTMPSSVLDLVERYDRNRAGYESSEYKEEQLRSEFLNPFFTALGWDVEAAHCPIAKSSSSLP